MIVVCRPGKTKIVSLFILLSKKLDKARQAYKRGDSTAARNVHVHSNLEDHSQGRYLKSLVYGGIDGVVTTFAIVAGVLGANLDLLIVLILGFANLIADGLSMAIGDFLSTRSEIEFANSERARELWEVRNFPQQEKDELIDIYVGKGMSIKDATEMVEILSKHEKSWIDTMMATELNIPESDESPITNGITTFLSFVVFGFLPLGAYVLAEIFGVIQKPFIFAAVLTAITLFVLGAVKARMVGINYIRSGFEMLFVGGIATAAAYAIGMALGKIL